MGRRGGSTYLSGSALAPPPGWFAKPPGFLAQSRRPRADPTASAPAIGGSALACSKRVSHGAATGRNRTARSHLGDRRDCSARTARPCRSPAGRAPAWIPAGVWRRPPGGARQHPRRRLRLLRSSVMRRLPTAVYRVIDEQELLGGEAVDWAAEGGAQAVRSPVPGPVVRRRAWRPRAAHRLGWASTASAAAALVCVALLLLHLPSQTRTPVAERRAARADHRDARSARVRSVTAPAAPRRARARPADHRTLPRRRTKAPRHGASLGVGAPAGARSAPVTSGSRVSYAPGVPEPGRAAAAQNAVALEFGFER